MTKRALPRIVVFACVAIFCVFAAWRVTGWMMAERDAQADPDSALGWRPGDPDAMLAKADQQLEAGNSADAAATARALLAREPLQGRAFAILAQAAGDAPDSRTLELNRIAVRRAPRDLQPRAWLTKHDLEQGDYRAAMVQIDRLLRLSPDRVNALVPAIVQLSGTPDFATALAETLSSDPPWRPAMLAALRDPKTGDPDAANLILQALWDRHSLSRDEYRAWLDSLLSAGRWGEAYARWATDVPKPGGRLPILYNGDFSTVSDGVGFDWRLRHVPGVVARYESAQGSDGPAAHLQFLGQGVTSAGLEHPLMLFPGNYRLTLRQRAQGMDSTLGLQWAIVCAGDAGVIGRSEAVTGSFDWQTGQTDFTVPEADCPGQWLELINPVGGGAGSRVTGELWVDAVHIMPRD